MQRSSRRRVALLLAALVVGGLLTARADLLRLSGLATLPAGTVLPPGAVFEATLEAVAAAGSTAPFAGAARVDPVPAGPGPLRFEIRPAAEFVGRRLVLRARVTNDERLLLASERRLRLQDAGQTFVELHLRPASGTVPLAEAVLGTPPASFVGDVSDGRHWQLDLLAGRRQQWRVSAAGVEVDGIGRWQVRGDRLLLDDAATAAFAVDGEAPVELLRLIEGHDRAGDWPEGLELRRRAGVPLLAPRLPLAAMYEQDAGGSWLFPCATGQRLGVAGGAGEAALSAAWEAQRTNHGERLLVELEGRISGAGEAVPEIEVRRFDGIFPKEGCPDRSLTPPLTATYWRLTRLAGVGVVGPAGPREAHLMLNEFDRRVAGSAGCNRIMGSYRQDDRRISFADMAMTMMACPAERRDEPDFVAVLGRVVGWQIDGRHLDLVDANGSTIARFEAVAERR